MKFIGIDLGWRSQPSGICCLEWQDAQLQLRKLERIDAIADILKWIDTCVQPTAPAIIAVDAPTIIPNATGSRLPDKLTHKYFGKYHAGCYPANLSLPFAARTINFGSELEARGFVHAPAIKSKTNSRYQIEVYPHPAIVNLFDLKRILKYKKGRLQARRVELTKLQNYIFNILPTLQPSLLPLQDDAFALEIPSTSALLKALEDKLDSLICAYVAAHWWYWGTERNLVLGDCAPRTLRDRTTGYIVVPKSILELE